MLKTIEDKVYKRMIQVATSLLRPYEHIDPMDVVNEVVLEAMEDKEFKHEGDLMKMIRFRADAYGKGRKGALNGRVRYIFEKTMTCRGCQQDVPATHFYLVKRKVTGQQEALYYCIDCHKKWVAEYCEKRKKNAKLMEAVIRANKKYQQKPEVKKKTNERAKKWHAENKEKFRAYQREWARKKREESKKNNQIPL
jgi:hypothetical protein